MIENLIPAPMLPLIKGRLGLVEKPVAVADVPVVIESLLAAALTPGAQVGSLEMRMSGKPVTAFFVVGP